jgi:hypothetical protein
MHSLLNECPVSATQTIFLLMERRTMWMRKPLDFAATLVGKNFGSRLFHGKNKWQLEKSR